MDIDTPERAPEGWTVLAVSGEIDVVAAPRLRDRLIELIADGDEHLLLDLDEVDFVDSTGLGVLVGALRRARSAAGDLRLVSSSARLAHLLSVTGLDKTFVVAEDLETAATAPDAGED